MLATREIKFEISDSARQYLAEQGYDPVFGARPLKRLMVREIDTPVSRMIIAGELLDGGTLKIDKAGDGLKMTTVNPEG